MKGLLWFAGAFTSPRASIQAEVFAVERAMAENRTVGFVRRGGMGAGPAGAEGMIVALVGAVGGVVAGLAVGLATRSAKYGAGAGAVGALVAGGGYYAWQRSADLGSSADAAARLQRWYAVLDAAPQATMTVGARSDARCVNEDPAPSSCFTCPPGTTITLDPRVPSGPGHFRCVPNGVTQFTV